MCRTHFLVVNAASFHEFLGKTRGNGDGGFDQVAALLKNMKSAFPESLQIYSWGWYYLHQNKIYPNILSGF
jgi:hypothetical protein